MKFKSTLIAASVLTALCGTSLVAGAQTIRIANQGDALSLDPHSLNESLQLSTTANVYESLVGRNKDLSVAPLLATSWKQTSPTVWRFELRKNVQFHDGTPFTADDVLFSFARAAGEGSDLKSNTTDIKELRKVNDHTIDIETKGPFPILPDVITTLMIMSKKWCEENKATIPVDRRKGIENTASFKANGTGPYRVRERQPNVRTTFVRNGTYWGKIEGNAQEVIFTPIANPATRVAALVSGEVDVMEPVPVQDIARINASPTARVIAGPELRTIFLGMDQKRDELLYSSVKGKNPFKDKKVRQAFYQAIDIVGIQRTVMRGASRPTALMVGPGITGWNAEQDKRLPYDPNVAKELLAQAGYSDGFEVDFACSNNAIVQDEQLCQAITAMWSRIGVKAKLRTQPAVSFYPMVQRHEASIAMLSWGVPTFDALYTLQSLTRTKATGGDGNYNLGRYSNERMDYIVDRVKTETDLPVRNRLLTEGLQLQNDTVANIPLHNQMLAWAMKKNVELVQRPDNRIDWRLIKVK